MLKKLAYLLSQLSLNHDQTLKVLTTFYKYILKISEVYFALDNK